MHDLPTALAAIIRGGRCVPIVGCGYPDFFDISIETFCAHQTGLRAPTARDFGSLGSRRLEQEAIAYWLNIARFSLQPVYEAIASIPSDTVIGLTPDDLLESILVEADPSWAALHHGQTSIRESRRIFLALAGDARRPDTVQLTDLDLMRLPFTQSQLWSVAERRSARAPFLLIGCDPRDRWLLRMVSWLRPTPEVPQAGWLACRSIASDDHARWKAAGFDVLQIEPPLLLRNIRDITSSSSSADVDTSPRSPAKPTQPYKYLNYFERTESDIFFGRTAETQQLIDLALSHRLIVVTGPSGAGKTSLVNAGLLSWLDRQKEHVGVYARCGSDPTAEIAKAVAECVGVSLALVPDAETLVRFLARARKTCHKPLIVVIDQAEELFTRISSLLRTAFLEALRECLIAVPDIARFVLILREDYLALLADMRDSIPSLLSNVLYIPELGREAALLSICQPAERSGISFDPKLASHIVDAIGLRTVSPPQIQLICGRLFEERDTTGIGFHTYNKLGGAKEILRGYLNAELDRAGQSRAQFQQVLKSMVTSQGTKDVLSIHDVANRAGIPTEVAQSLLLDLRDRSRLLRSVQQGGEPRFELAHEYLTGEIWGWMSQTDVQRRRIEELLGREKQSWQRFKHLRLGLDRLKLFQSAHDLFKPDEQELILLLLSAVRHRQPADAWTSRASQLPAERQDFIVDQLFDYFHDKEMRQRRDAAEVIALLNPAPLKRALASPDAARRKAALAMIGGIEYRPAARSVAQHLTDEDEEVRLLACGALGELGGPIATKALVSIARTNERGLARAIVVALARSGHSVGYQEIIAALGSSDSETVLAAKEGLRLAKNPQIIHALLSHGELSSSGRDAVWDVIQNDPVRKRFIPPILRLLRSNVDVEWYRAKDLLEHLTLSELRRFRPSTKAQRSWVAERKEHFHGKESVEREARKEVEARFSTLEEPTPEELSTFLSASNEEDDFPLIFALIEWLEEVSAKRLGLLSKLIEHSDYQLRAIAMTAASHLTPIQPSLHPSILSGLDDEDTTVVYYACLAARHQMLVGAAEVITQHVSRNDRGKWYRPDVGNEVGNAASFALDRLVPRSGVWRKPFQTTFG